jgi:sortase A
MLLKAGVIMMTFALAFAAVVAVVALRDEPMEVVVAKPAAKPSVEPLVRNYLPPKPQVKAVETEPKPEPQRPEPQRPVPQKAEPRPETRPRPEPEREILPVAEEDWPMPTEVQIQNASEPRHYRLPPGAVMGLTIKALGIYNVPVYDSDGKWALNNGVSHMPGTSFPWSRTPQRNVYLAGHRLGWPGTYSHLVFYNLNKLGRGDEILLRKRDGTGYRYRVTEAFITGPGDSWVMGQVRGRDMVTLQTCTPIPAFDKRLIVRADRA